MIQTIYIVICEHVEFYLPYNYVMIISVSNIGLQLSASNLNVS
jgi:hypothetical protein